MEEGIFSHVEISVATCKKKKKKNTVKVQKFQTFYTILFCLNFAFYSVISVNTKWNGKQCRPDQTVPSGVA